MGTIAENLQIIKDSLSDIKQTISYTDINISDISTYNDAILQIIDSGGVTSFSETESTRLPTEYSIYTSNSAKDKLINKILFNSLILRGGKTEGYLHRFCGNYFLIDDHAVYSAEFNIVRNYNWPDQLPYFDITIKDKYGNQTNTGKLYADGVLTMQDSSTPSPSTPSPSTPGPSTPGPSTGSPDSSYNP